MSNASQGPGWWKASDDKWYPPETDTEAGALLAAESAPIVRAATTDDDETVTKWEYRTVSTLYNTESADTIEDVIRSLNRLGDQGWEIVGEITFQHCSEERVSPNPAVLAKRRKPS